MISSSAAGAPSTLPLFLLGTLVAVHIVERYAVAGDVPAAAVLARRDRLATHAVRAYFIFLIYLVFFAIAARPLYSFVGTLTFFAVFVCITRAKYRFVREPLVFADVALLPLLLRHRELFYANWLGALFWAGAFLYIFGVSALFFLHEEPLRPEGAWRLAGFAALFVMALPGMLLFVPGWRRYLGAAAAWMLSGCDPRAATRRFGPFAYVVLHFVEWLGYARAVAPALAEGRREAAAAFMAREPSAGPPVILVWQSESFLDMRRFGAAGLDLPVLDRLKARACRHGLVDSVFEGGYTMRTEFAVLSGIAPQALGPDSFYPYLAAAAYAAPAWPQALRAAGMKTLFIHPYDGHFFNRHKAMPALGFDRLLMREAFDGQAFSGPYVPDALLGERVLEICREEKERGLFVFCATMENHGPWKPGRVEGAADAPAVYRSILKGSDAALGALVDGLDRLGRPVWLLFYGDHAPLLPASGEGLRDARTDYLIVASGSLKRPSAGGTAKDILPSQMMDELLACAASHGATP